MADPISITAILTALYGGLQIVLDVMPELLREAHDANTKRRLTKLNALFLKAQIDEFTEEDFEQAKHYYVKIEAVALMCQNEMMLEALRNGLDHLKATLVVKKILNEKLKLESLPESEKENAEEQTVKVDGARIETDDEAPLHVPTHIGNLLSHATSDEKLAKLHTLKLTVKNLMHEKPKTEPSDSESKDPEERAVDLKIARTEMAETHNDEVQPGLPILIDHCLPHTTPDGKLARFYALKRPAMYGMMTVFSQLQAVPSFRHHD